MVTVSTAWRLRRAEHKTAWHLTQYRTMMLICWCLSRKRQVAPWLLPILVQHRLRLDPTRRLATHRATPAPHWAIHPPNEPSSEIGLNHMKNNTHLDALTTLLSPNTPPAAPAPSVSAPASAPRGPREAIVRLQRALLQQYMGMPWVRVAVYRDAMGTSSVVVRQCSDRSQRMASPICLAHVPAASTRLHCMVPPHTPSTP